MRPHRAELEDGEGGAALADPVLAVEQRAAVADAVPDHTTRDHQTEHHASEQRKRDVEDALGPAVPSAVHLADVEEQRRPLEL